MDEAHLAPDMRYLSLNPVRAHMVERAEDYAWSSVRAGLRGSRRKPGGPSRRKSAGQSRAIRAERVTSSFVCLMNCHRIPTIIPMSIKCTVTVILGGYYVIEVDDLNMAISWAKQCLGADYGDVEIRPVIGTV